MAPRTRKDTGATADRALHRKALAGDRDAFAELVQKYECRVLRMAYRLLGNVEDARDAAQEVFLRLFRYRHRFRLSRRLEPWLYRMTLNVCRDMGKKRRTEPSLDETRLPLAENPSVPGTDRQALLHDRQRVLEEGLRRLKETERLVLILRDIEGLSTRDVSRILRMPAGTVRSHLSRARLKLARYVAARWEESP